MTGRPRRTTRNDYVRLVSLDTCWEDNDVYSAAQGTFTHVYVQRATQKPVEIPDDVRRVLEGLRTLE